VTTLRLAIIGDGKMGHAVSRVATDQGVDVVAMLGVGQAVTRDALAGAAVAIEFTEPGAAAANVRACLAAGCPVVVGTTGWYDQLDPVSHEVLGAHGAMLWSANFSLGVHLFGHLVEYAGELFARVPSFDAHLVETHHAAKKDAPSGTARMLGSMVEPGLGRPLPITSIRVGSVPGTHELIFDGTYEQITVTHVARDRRVFAEGALAAARWLVGRTGVFTLADMLGTHRPRT